MTDTITATKHHGLGNDFLVVLADALPADVAGLAEAMCHRYTGIGADGLIYGLPDASGEADLVMVLHNSDGTRAEMSGNGIRCLAQAEIMRRGVDTELRIRTDGGLRTVGVTSTATGLVDASVEMGAVGEGPGVAGAVATHSAVRQAATGDMGNPHLVVLVDDPADIDVAGLGAQFESEYPGGMNVEFIRAHPSEPDTIELAVWERGAGVTLACGTGATAAATRAHEWGLVGSRSEVRMPGGVASVIAPAEPGATATLIGPSQYIARIEWPTR